MKFFGSMTVENNSLKIGGVDCSYLVKEYGSPLYVVDEKLIKNICERYVKAFKVNERGNRVAYAGKAFLITAMCRLIDKENLCLDVVSGGELYTAYKSNFPLEKVYFHGNNKTKDEVDMGIELGVGRFVVDNDYEMELINEIAKKKNRIQKVILRVTPGIEAHTHEYIKTGQVDSKFGFTLLNDKVIDIVKKCIALPNIKLMGFHCHIGSQIFETKPYVDECEIMMKLIKKVKDELGYEIKELDLGGGFGVYYSDGDRPKKIEEYCEKIIDKVDEESKELQIDVPKLTIEPGRSIIGNAGTTLYTVGAIKNIPGIRKYVSVDGGMSDNIRPSLYGAKYECAIANKVSEKPCETVTIAGKCCESGDILLKDIRLPEVQSGDILAVFTTGAYGYSMASNYNKIPKPAVVFVEDGKNVLKCRRESYEDIIRNELF